MRLTPFSSNLTDAMITSDGKTLYFITRGNGGNVLWDMDLREREVNSSKNISSGLSAFETTPDGKHAFLLGRTMNKFNDGKITPISYSGQQRLDHAAEREFMFDNMAREEQHRFYDVKMHGVDWPALTQHYRKFLPHINNNYDFSEMLSEILGEPQREPHRIGLPWQLCQLCRAHCQSRIAVRLHLQWTGPDGSRGGEGQPV